MIDYQTIARKQFISEQTSRALKLADAIEYLKSRDKHCFTTPLNVRIYSPVHGSPLGVCK